MKNLKTAYLKLNSSELTEQDWFDLSYFFRLDPRFFEAAIVKFSEEFINLNPSFQCKSKNRLCRYFILICIQSDQRAYWNLLSNQTVLLKSGVS